MCNSPQLRSASASFTAVAASNYGANELVANSATAGSVTPMSFAIGTGEGRGIKIVGATLQKSGTAVTNATFTLWLFTTSPTSTAGDNEAFASTTVSTSGFIGTVAFPICSAFTDDARAVVNVGDQTGGINPLHVYLSSSSILYGLLVTAAAYTDETAGETFTVTIIYEQYE